MVKNLLAMWEIWFLLGGGEEEIREEFKKKVAFELGLELTC